MAMRLVLAILLSVVLSACGGGGGGATTATPPAAPTGVTAVAEDGYVLIDTLPVSGATAYKIYWSTTSGVTKSNGTMIPVVTTPKVHTVPNGTYYYVVTAVNAAGESVASAQVSASPAAVTAVADPLFVTYQWHLSNTGQHGALPGQDMNVSSAWTAGYKGAGVRIAIVDNGLEIGHEDLARNVSVGQSHNYVTGTSDPTEAPTDTSPENGHGTSCAGIAAARDSNGLGGEGVAPRASLVGYNLLQSSSTTNEIDAMTRNIANVSVSSNSWGATDGTGELSTRPLGWQTAIDFGVANGRGGKGTLYMWAAGNGALPGNTTCGLSWDCIDNSNYDSQANYRGVMAVGAVNDQGVQSSYSESGANLWVASPGGEFCSTTQAITTVDRTGTAGQNTTATASVSDLPNQNYTKCMNGTSSATPGAAGIVALMLSANPNLGWRDVRIILAKSARKNDVAGGGWVTNGGGYHFSHKYGFGVVDGSAAVTAALTYVANVGKESTYTTPLSSPNAVIIDPTASAPSPAATTSIINVPANTGISSIEWVEVTFTATALGPDKASYYSGDFDVSLTSPAGTVSQLAVAHKCAGTNWACTSKYSGWVFGSAAHLGETVTGDWKLTVKDGVQGGGNGTFDSWQLKFYGN